MAVRVVVLAIVAWCTPALAQPSELAIAWQAPSACPTETAVRAKIEQRLGRSLDETFAAVSVDVAPDRGKFVAHVDLRALTLANDVRTLTSKRCDDLADAVALIVARVATEAATRRAEARKAEAAAKRLATRDADDSITLEKSATLAGPRRWSYGARLSAISGIGVVPQVGWAGEVSAYVRRNTTMAELAYTRWLASSKPIHWQYTDPAHLDVGLDVTSARIGWRPEKPPLRAWLAVDVGKMEGAGVGTGANHFGSGRWVAAGAGFGVGWPMTRWARLVGMTEVVFAFERVRFQLNEGVVIYQPAPMAARASVGLEVGWE